MFPETTVVSGVQFYPFKTNFDKDIQRSISIMGTFVFPICMCMCLPVFLYQIVLEKETRLIETMKINGMRMYNYWIVNFFFNLGIYCITAIVYVFFGAYIFGIELFNATSLSLLILLMLGWGLA